MVSEEQEENSEQREHGNDQGEGHDVHGSHGEPWLVSYADMMTLLFGFFVLMYSFENAKVKGLLQEDDSMTRIRKEIAVYFGGTYAEKMTQMAEQVKQVVGNKNELLKNFKIDSDPEGVRINLTSEFLFPSGSSELSAQSQPILSQIVETIRAGGPDTKIRIEGYTDDNPISTEKFPSNWELSGARAASVLRLFEKAGWEPDLLMAVGFGSSRAAYANRTTDGTAIPENQALNRRVVISVHANLEKKQGERGLSPKVERAAAKIFRESFKGGEEGTTEPSTPTPTATPTPTVSDAATAAPNSSPAAGGSESPPPAQ
jgi:chemotaxis protein MotB